MKGSEFAGHSSEMRGDSPWLSSEDIMGRGDVEVEIERCERFENVPFDGGRVEPVCYALSFKGKKRKLVLNTVNRKTLVKAFGVNVKDWKGQRVKLWVDENVRFRGNRVCGIRIKVDE